MEIGNYAAIFIAVGFIGGQQLFNETLRHTNWRALDSNGENPLNVNGDEELWLVLAQQYIENGITKTSGGTVDLNQRTDPKFLHPDIWKYYVQDFKQQPNHLSEENVADQLKQKCKHVFAEDFNIEQYQQAKKWCSLVIPENFRRILKWQQQNGNCRLWLTTYPKFWRGYYPLEAQYSKFNTEKRGDKTSIEWLLDSLYTSKAIKENCKRNYRKIVPLDFVQSFDKNNKESIVWKIAELPPNGIQSYGKEDDIYFASGELTTIRNWPLIVYRKFNESRTEK